MLFNAVIAVALGGGLFSTVAHGLAIDVNSATLSTRMVGESVIIEARAVQSQNQNAISSQNANAANSREKVKFGQGVLSNQFQNADSFNNNNGGRYRRPSANQVQDADIKQDAKAINSKDKVVSDQTAVVGQTQVGDIANEHRRPSAASTQQQNADLAQKALVEGTGRGKNAEVAQNGFITQAQESTVDAAGRRRPASTTSQKQVANSNQEATIINSKGKSIVDQFVQIDQTQDSLSL